MHRHGFWELGCTLVDTYPALDAALVDVVAAHGASISLTEVAAFTRHSTDEAIRHLSKSFDIDPTELERANADLKRRWSPSRHV